MFSLIALRKVFSIKVSVSLVIIAMAKAEAVPEVDARPLSKRMH